METIKKVYQSVFVPTLGTPRSSIKRVFSRPPVQIQPQRYPILAQMTGSTRFFLHKNSFQGHVPSKFFVIVDIIRVDHRKAYYVNDVP